MSKIMKILLISLCIGGILSLGVAGAAERPFRTNWSWPTYIDPAVGSDFSSSVAFVNLYDTLLYPDVKGNPQPHVAKSWKASADGLTWTFHLRPGIKFHDGTELTAEDVKFSMDRLTTIGEGYAYLFGKVANTEAPDKYTVAFHLKESFGPFLATLFRLYIVNKDLVMANIKRPGPYGDMGDYGKQYLLTHDAGSGPYVVKEFPLEEYLLMVQNPNYWQPINLNAPDEYKMIGTCEPVTVRTMMSRRELEIADQWQPVESLKALEKIEGVEIGGFFSGSEHYYMMHTKKPPTDDIHFRKAMAWAMDYKTVVDKIYVGSVQARGPVNQTIPGADPTVFQYHRNLDKAMAELKQSKYYGQLDKYPVVVDWVSIPADNEKVALLFMSTMADIGIEVEIVKTPWGSIIEEMATEETSPNIAGVFVAPHYPEAGSLLASRYGSKSVATWEQNEWLLDPKFDAMIEDALKTVDREERFAKYGKIQRYIIDLCPSLFLFDQLEKHAYQAAYTDWPAARGEAIPIMGYNFAGRFIKVYSDKRTELLK
ncbi:MAG: ABC transporter substrate-binding protein [Candidatus Aerophobetes bacterium]|nr:ABC transporter substrate-binding protein [Candidatus Aerophobetes bacterium]